MKIALTSMDIKWEDKSVNRKKCMELIKRASDVGARLILFPEMTLTGFTMNPGQYGETVDAEGNFESVRFFAEQSAVFGLAIGFGYIRWNPESRKGQNYFAVVDRGCVLGEYQKIHPFSYGMETGYYEPGRELVSVELEGVRMGLSICYDLRFPEIYQKLSETCQMLAIIANWPESRVSHWKCLLQARAIETQSVVCGVNRKGTGGGLSYCPSSRMFDCEGREQEAVCVVTSYGDECLFYDIKMDEIAEKRKDFPIKKDRKKEIYRTFYGE